MERYRIKKSVGIFLALVFLFINYSPWVQNLKNIPSELKIFEGDAHILKIGLPLTVKIEADNVNVLKFNGNSLKDQPNYNMAQPLTIQTVSKGDAELIFKLFGIIPIKQMRVKVAPVKKVFPGGNSIGVSMYTQGALVVGISEVMDPEGFTHYPASEAGLRPGDVIEKVNGIEVENADHLSKLVNQVKEEGLELEVRRGNTIFKTHIVPVKDMHDSKYRLGIWVRDSTAGVGTLTFYDPDTGCFGALGHAITDIDTGVLLSVKNGEIMQSTIIDVKQGRRGEPGELKGVFSSRQKAIGSIVRNTQYGIYGKMYHPLPKFYYDKPLPVCSQYDVKVGKASILTTVDEEGVKEFEVQIVRVNVQQHPSSKGMVIEITDPKLLSRTGGIVQGMSGSPIIQDGKIVGAITHVFVNDPRKGYGIFIEWMLEECRKIVD
ncbi:stage IV sporulation protein B [Caldicoprobacter guelmensis]|uniref:SpoIVB peptidase n=1 Tax=Caldicoprobacter guelmensis TaxID=1170224 RepID=UPI00195E72AC|nr:SpoIVB peptidase [Caldicoprobacter guelmensis]MBM7581307.1 stage IV sporulation protein B [Caldicoprobacter guelmensis]